MGRRIFWGYAVGLILLGCTNREEVEWETCFICPKPNVFYFPADTHTVQDESAFNQATRTCKRKGRCLTKFTVVEHGRYHAICGLKEERLCRK